MWPVAPNDAASDWTKEETKYFSTSHQREKRNILSWQETNYNTEKQQKFRKYHWLSFYESRN